MAASDNLGSWLAASMPYEAMALQAAFCMKAPHENDFGQASEAAQRFNDLQQNRTSFGDN